MKKGSALAAAHAYIASQHGVYSAENHNLWLNDTLEKLHMQSCTGLEISCGSAQILFAITAGIVYAS
ncbi:MAG: hypothetical protein BCS36_12365 [Desulfovibrio sp. MES5]|nr:MAG: hypothetical protein BCS36_12365 [Desulfovibrio sp. MES5]